MVTEAPLDEITARSKLKNTLSKITPINAEEEQHLAEALTWIKSDAPLYRIKKPNTPDKHLATFVIVLNENKDKILLVDHKLAKQWLPAGGHVENNEDPMLSALREANEELGIENPELLANEPVMLSIENVADGDLKHADVTFWFTIIHSEEGIKMDDDEFNSVRWFDLHDIPSNCARALPMVIDKLKAQYL